MELNDPDDYICLKCYVSDLYRAGFHQIASFAHWEAPCRCVRYCGATTCDPKSYATEG